MSTDMMTYLNYISTWDNETDKNIQTLIDEQFLFTQLGDFDSDTAVNREFDTLEDLAKAVRDNTIARDAMLIAADAAAVAAIWTFGFGMAAYAALETAALIENKVISNKSKELNQKLTTVDVDISSSINDNVQLYVVAYKANNNLIAANAPKGLNSRTCRSLLMQFLAQVHKNTGQLNVANVKKYAESARKLYNSDEIKNVYDALDTLNLSDRTNADQQKFFNYLKGFTFPDSWAVTMVHNFSVAIMALKLRIANKTIAENAKQAGFEIEGAETSAFGMLDALGKFATVVAVAMSVVDAVLNILDIVDVVEQCKAMCDELEGSIKDSYTSYFNGIKTAAKAYNAAIAGHTSKADSEAEWREKVEEKMEEERKKHEHDHAPRTTH